MEVPCVGHVSAVSRSGRQHEILTPPVDTGLMKAQISLRLLKILEIMATFTLNQRGSYETYFSQELREAISGPSRDASRNVHLTTRLCR